MFGLSTIKLVIIGVVVAAIVGYISYLNIRITYLKAEIVTYEAVIAAQDTKLKSLEDITKAKDKVRAEQSTAQAKEIFRLQNQRIKDINELKSLKDIVIPDLARRLFNSTTETGRDEEGTPGNTNGGDAKTSPPVDSRIELEKQGAVRMGPITLAELLVANETNKANYLSCRNSVAGWQQLWKETESNLNGTP